MTRQKAKILVAIHKPAMVYKDGVFMPVHVGHGNSKLDLGFLGDDTGENISDKNANYCELTALYWAWKNLKEIDYIGLCHYRRYFDLSTHDHALRQITEDELEAFGRLNSSLLQKRMARMEDDEVILPRFWSLPHAVLEEFQDTVLRQDMHILFHVIKKMYPDYMSTVEKYLLGNRRTGYNMFVMSKRQFDNYANWLFSILQEVERRVKLSPYITYRRVFGYMGEWLLPIYCIHNHLRIRQERICMVTDISRTTSHGMKYLKNKLCDVEFSLYRKLGDLSLSSDFWDNAMKADKIDDI